MSGFRKAMVYLGLVDDEQYDDEFEYADDVYVEEPAPAPAPAARRAGGSAAASGDSGSVTVVRTTRRAAAAAEPVDTAPRPTPLVRPIPIPSTRVHVMDPRGFNDAQEVGDRLKAGQPVILNLQGVDRDLQRRLIDFSSGIAYALSGTMSKAADQVFLLTPSNVEVSDEEKERLQARGLYRAGR
ncbi:MAG TPA: cell division protein SepF [Acidimicrobiia bacterium]|nr:cell division protein SepF [Acidimicrobiia bacterium]